MKSDKYWWEQTDHLEIKNGRLRFCNRDLEDIATKFGTPLYVYNLQKVEDNYLRVSNTLKKYAGESLDTRVYYAMKANGAPEILETIKSQNGFIDTSCVAEVQKAIEAGFDPNRIIFTGTNFGLDNFEFLAKSGVLINVDSFSQLRRLKDFAPLKISIRLNPNVGGIGFNDKFDMSGSGIRASRLGIYIDRIIEAFHTARSYGLEPICLHQHAGSNWLRRTSFDAYIKSVKTAIDVVARLEQDGFNIEILNLGGGLGVRSHQNYPEFPLEEYCAAITAAVLAGNTKLKCIAIEPGRYIVGDTGVLLATSNLVEEKNGVNYLGIDVGFNAFHHKFMYGIDNVIVNVSKVHLSPKRDYAVVGYLGEPGDVFSDQELLPASEEGDIIMLYPAGAYCASELAVHHFLPVPKELFLKKKDDQSDLNLKNYCKACRSNCCYGSVVNVTEEEYKSISKVTKRHNVFSKTINGVYQIDNSNGQACPFFDLDTQSCTIQAVKPIECRAYPIMTSENGSGVVGHKCPASSFITSEFIRNAEKLIKKIPDELQRKFYQINVEKGFVQTKAAC